MESGESGGRGEWSVVVTSYSGEYWDFAVAAAEAFGKRGFDATGVATYPDTYLPAEIADGLEHDRAQEVAQRLRESNATVIVARSDDLPAVRHRAAEFWSERCVGGYGFNEIEGRVTTTGAANTRRWLENEEFADSPLWQQEAFLNHEHFGLRKGDWIAGELEEVERLKLALLEAYPDRDFTIWHSLGDQISFWQTTLDSPREHYMLAGCEEKREAQWCQQCQEMRQHMECDRVDPRFPEAKWGRCTECGAETLIADRERLTFIGPSADRMTTGD